MSADELQELHEHAEHAAHNRELAPVSLTMAFLAVLVAVVSLLGHRAHTEEVVLQSRANDQWGYYQGKDTRLHIAKKFAELDAFVACSVPGATEVERAAREHLARNKDRQIGRAHV